MKYILPSNLICSAIAIFFLLGINYQSLAAEVTAANAEDILWLVAQKKNTSDGYETFISQYSDGKYSALARAAINKFKTDKAVQVENAGWKVLLDSEDGPLIQQYLDKYPKGVNVAAAKLKLAAIRKIETQYKPGQAFKGCVTCPEMVIVPAGSFVMGDGANAHRVTFANPFVIGKKEVTQKEWIAVMGSNPSKFKDCVGNCPVDNVSWNDAKEYVRRLNIKTGKEYRLPSEAEWEYSCRSGTQQAFCGGDNANSVAWYGAYSTPTAKRTDRYSKQVAMKKANAWGLYDMSGNVAEWTEDGYHADFVGAPTDGSAWRGDGQGYILRGGSWESNLDQIRATARDYDNPANSDITYGFRVARKFP